MPITRVANPGDSMGALQSLEGAKRELRETQCHGVAMVWLREATDRGKGVTAIYTHCRTDPMIYAWCVWGPTPFGLSP